MISSFTSHAPIGAFVIIVSRITSDLRVTIVFSQDAWRAAEASPTGDRHRDRLLQAVLRQELAQHRGPATHGSHLRILGQQGIPFFYGKGGKYVYWNRFRLKKGGHAVWEGDIMKPNHLEIKLVRDE